MYIEADDLRQSYVVARNEIVKFLRGRRLLVYSIITILFFALITVAVFLQRDWIENNGVDVSSLYTSFLYLLLIIAATLFASVTIVSEFEERTALILFTRPIKKTPIFLGKLIGCIILEVVVIIVYYLLVAVVSFAFNGQMSDYLPTSLVIACLYMLSATGIGMLFSSILKRSSTATIVTLLVLFLILPLLVGLFSMCGNVDDIWFLLSVAANAIVVPDIGGSVEHVARDAGVMIVWFIIPTIAAWFAFIKREF
jgi:ABC-2 type transport system permease protein